MHRVGQSSAIAGRSARAIAWSSAWLACGLLAVSCGGPGGDLVDEMQSEAAAAKSAGIVGTHPTNNAVWRSWATDSKKGRADDNFAYNAAHASKVNHGRTLADVTIATPDGRVELTESVALAGAIASVKYRGEELIHATHGAAFQYHIRYSDIGMYKDGKLLLSECDNPTEGGNHRNFDARRIPRIDPSSSYIEAIGKDRVGGLQRMYSRNAPVDYVPPGYASDDYGNGRCSNPAHKAWFSGFKIHKWVTAGWYSPVARKRYDNVIQLDAQMDVPRRYRKKLVQLELVAYFRRWALNQYDYDTIKNKLTYAANTLAGEANVAKIFTNPDKSFAAGLIAFHMRGSPILRDDPRTTRVYEAAEVQPSLYSARADSPYVARYMQADWHFTYPSKVRTKAFFVLGSLSQVKSSLRAISREMKRNAKAHGVVFEK
jgi:hypothetical protein